ncbi:hypothetical protein ORD22_06450 [Sporosarcina sp. GW1-11]|uniref:YqgU-like beta propeller domain-containing protein n=1 Tax=Sporosarcina sp. GW1-11 TaxID=2899126 RepID=UPI00294C6ACB|nr:hypothetical protein [Sporosarcina sp. GW1-11]MDV6377902.1 hypothetical protein [Sporosarcina sp. GW1-11]
MKRIILPTIATIFLLGCQQQEVEAPEPTSSVEEEVVTQTVNVSEEEFRFVAGWLDDQTIGFVVHQEEEDRLQTFNIVTGEVETLYTNPAIISEVLIHPSKQQFLVKTADKSTEANIIVFTNEAQVLDELVVESSELEINWNPVDPSELLLSAFADDWSYQMYLYDAKEQAVTPITLADPFPQWLGGKDVVYIEDTALVKETLETNEKKILAPEANQFHASSTQLLLVVFEDETSNYKLFDVEGEEISTWISEDPTQVVENVEMIDEDNIIMSTTNQTSATPTAFVHHVQHSKEVKRYEVDIESSLLSCASAYTCLTGNRFETLLQLETGETVDWLIINE